MSEELTDTIASYAEALDEVSLSGALPVREDDPPEVREAKGLALRYRFPYVDLLPPDGDSPIDYALL
ncbi:MAG TPA: hypothetical protein VEV81_05765, partial [Pyrinomonadaceae bacterium]|nr:hypothetical protein [Pyrinomonadaceae bacterium]